MVLVVVDDCGGDLVKTIVDLVQLRITIKFKCMSSRIVTQTQLDMQLSIS